MEFPKVVRRGCKRSFGPEGTKSMLHWCNLGFLLVQKGFQMVQETPAIASKPVQDNLSS